MMKAILQGAGLEGRSVQAEFLMHYCFGAMEQWSVKFHFCNSINGTFLVRPPLALCPNLQIPQVCILISFSAVCGAHHHHLPPSPPAPPP